ncbi:malonyl-CoA O-methyltransferase [Sphingomonas sp. YR710]|jgi:malonyl-CoA O-methyltransferase|uniref:methyltransferase domain-containing protein n=1 Tax=Sphingomonas sp. YR710 TaxID=1882773 RepID=UPI000882CDA7|nr:methyltransferase domain-containing protein [Sphingomonas sp. YR710]SDD22453.1 malonyl-CoA O-methyltransferase [Sphingomonas sp. YR710]
MTDARKSRIARAFGQADDYARKAIVQRQVAQALARKTAALPLPATPHVLEIGCGTGFLTGELARWLPGSRWTVTDIAPEMIARAATITGIAGDYRVMDGEQPIFDGAMFDLIASSLTFQWFSDQPSAVMRLAGLLRPGGWIAFATMAAGSFPEWHAAHRAAGLIPATPAYPDQMDLAAMAPAGFAADISIESFVQPHDDAWDFMRRLKAIGAGVPREGHRALSPSALRAVASAYDDGPRTATYRIGFCLLRAPD